MEMSAVSTRRWKMENGVVRMQGKPSASPALAPRPCGRSLCDGEGASYTLNPVVMQRSAQTYQLHRHVPRRQPLRQLEIKIKYPVASH